MLKERNVLPTDKQLAITNLLLLSATSSTGRLKSSTLLPFTTHSLPNSLALCKVQKKYATQEHRGQKNTDQV